VKRVITLPAGVIGEGAVAFTSRARRLGAELLEVRDDLTDSARLDVDRLGLPLLLAHRAGRGFTPAAERAAALVDAPHGPLVSWHAPAPLTPAETEAHWASVPATMQVKHVEPLGDDGARLLETQRRLAARFRHVTVLATGACALPWRAALAKHNALDYLAVDNASASAVGQRLLRDAVRADGHEGPRLALIGHRIEHARSPLAHPQPFDRWDLPPDAPVGALADAMRTHYRGFAVTAPFKQVLAAHVGAKHRAINTLVRRPDGWGGFNTDVEGARAVLERHGFERFTILGDGGAAWALRAAGTGVPLKARDAGIHIGGDVVWTWPEHVATPSGLRLDGARVLVITYGAAARRLSQRITALGGQPLRCGARWFAAQARAQRRLWQEAS
jgi:hypothetical protein